MDLRFRRTSGGGEPRMRLKVRAHQDPQARRPVDGRSEARAQNDYQKIVLWNIVYPEVPQFWLHRDPRLTSVGPSNVAS